MQKDIKVSHIVEHEGNLGEYCASHWTGTKSRCSKLCKAGHVLINGRRVFATASIKPGDHLEITSFLTSNATEVGSASSPLLDPREINRTIDYFNHILCTLPPGAENMVLYEDDHVAVLNKPAGQHSLGWLGTMKRQSLSFDSVLPLLLRPAPAEAVAPLDRLDRPLPCHRLDARVSGCLVVAKTAPALSATNALFASRRVEKRYIAVCCGDTAAALQAAALVSSTTTTSTTTSSSSSSRSLHVEATAPSDDASSPTYLISSSMDGTDALTTCTVMGSTGCPQYGTLSLVRLMPVTGRRHQLRKHCAYLGTPIVGDDLFHDAGTLEGDDRDDEGEREEEEEGGGEGEGEGEGDGGSAGAGSRAGVRKSMGLFLSCVGVALPHPVAPSPAATVRVDLPTPAKFARLLDRAKRGWDYDEEAKKTAKSV